MPPAPERRRGAGWPGGAGKKPDGTAAEEDEQFAERDVPRPGQQKAQRGEEALGAQHLADRDNEQRERGQRHRQPGRAHAAPVQPAASSAQATSQAAATAQRPWLTMRPHQRSWVSASKLTLRIGPCSVDQSQSEAPWARSGGSPAA